jgi:predicted transcriptional regulator
MYTASMKRTQIYLDEEAWARIERLAKTSGRSAAAVVRDAVATYLAGEEPGDDDPILALIDWAAQNPIDTGPTDAAKEHDHYLYGAPKGR